MFIRQIKQSKYEQFVQKLKDHSPPRPLECSYDVPMEINKWHYTVRIQPERHCRIAVLQAIRMVPAGATWQGEMITSGSMLSALLELLLYQECREFY